MMFIANAIDNFEDLVRVATIPPHLFREQTAVAFSVGIDGFANLVFGFYSDKFAPDELVILPLPPTEHVTILTCANGLSLRFSFRSDFHKFGHYRASITSKPDFPATNMPSFVF